MSCHPHPPGSSPYVSPTLSVSMNEKLRALSIGEWWWFCIESHEKSHAYTLENVYTDHSTNDVIANASDVRDFI